MRVLLLGCGNVGSSVAKQLVARNPGIQCVIGDINIAAAEELAEALGNQTLSVKVDINDPTSLDAALQGADLVFNAIGPFYRSAEPVIEAALRTGVDYIDINDDHDVAEKLLKNGGFASRAKQAGIKIILGCGSTPGLTNVMARLLVDRMDRATAIHLSTIVPFAPNLLSPAVIDHMMHITSGEVVQFECGKYVMKPGWGGELGVTYQEPFGTVPGYYIGHGETVTLPHFISGLEQVSNRIGFFPEQGNDIWRQLIELGFANNQVIPEIGLSPLQFLMAYLPTEEAKSAMEVDMSDIPWGVACRVEVEGYQQNNRVKTALEYHISLPTDDSEEERDNDPTPTCARIAIETYLKGDIQGEGLLSPEVCFEPVEFVKQFIKDTGAKLFASESKLTEGLD